MYVIHHESGKKIRAIVSKLDKKEIAVINKSGRFHFNWNQEAKYEVYKLTATGVNEPLGLISIEDRISDYAVQIRLLASSKNNIGEGKEYERIAGCLIAFACKKSFSAGYEGYVCLKPKTDLEIHYQNAYGMKSTGMYLITEQENSLMLIKRYNEEQN